MYQVYFIPLLLPFLVPALYYYLSVQKDEEKKEAYKHLFQLSIIIVSLVICSFALGVYSIHAESTRLRLFSTALNICVPIAYVLSIFIFIWKSKNTKMRRVYVFNFIISTFVILAGWTALYLMFSMSNM